ncbi:MAG: hypothetical protein J6M17_00995 [Ruminococcus sp.]|nr:hypothetical protein [Ruminococcus sp.]
MILHFSATVQLHAARDGISIKLKFMGFTLYPRKKKHSAEEQPSLSDDDFEDELEDDIDSLEEAEDIADEQPAEQNDEHTPSAEENTPSETVGEQWDGEPENDDNPVLEEDKKKDKKSKKTDSSKKSGGIRAKIQSLRAKWEKYSPYIPTTWKLFRKLCKAVRFSIDDVWIEEGRVDAHEAAVFYGMIQAAVTEIIHKLAVIFTCKVKKCRVDVRWAEDHIDGGADITVRVRPSTLIAIVLCIGIRYPFIYFGQKLKKRKQKKALKNNNQASAEPV